ncbi:MAG: hypothetical protein RPU73_06145 [Candidatus Sedimenticola sp. (ex Thyasira tokunagai)]
MTSEETLYNSITDSFISIDDLSSLSAEDKETQIDVMRNWFFSNFEDPAQHCPYESKEGGYQYIYGGPYDASEQLFDMFGEYINEEIIEELVEELHGQCWEWSGVIREDFYDDYLLEEIKSFTDALHNFQDAILDIEGLLELNPSQFLQNNLNKLLFINLIFSLESYLAETFIFNISEHDFLLKKFVKTTPKFQKEKITISSIFDEIEKVEEKAKSHLINMVWHNIAKVKIMFKQTLNVSFPEDISWLTTAIDMRHDIVHRNGKTKDGSELYIEINDVKELKSKLENFVLYIDKQIKNLTIGST